MAGNSVAANLIMLVCLVGGLIMGLQLKQEVFPDFDMDQINVTVSYPGAGPEEVENGIILPIEEAIQGLEGVDDISSTAQEGSATVVIEALEGADVNRLWQDVQSEIDRITTFPDEAEDPQVAIASHQREVLQVVLYGDTDEGTLRRTAEDLRDDMLLNPAITQVELSGVRDYEIHVEVPMATLRRYGLTLQDVADAISASSVELGSGSLKTDGGDILVRINDRRYDAGEFGNISLMTEDDGAQIKLSQVATVTEGFEETDTWASYDGKPAVMINVYRVGNQTPTEVADAAHAVLAQFNLRLPQGMQTVVHNDSSEIFVQRAELLLGNAYLGLVLVFICLALFLEIRLAFWVSLGIPISFLGSFLLLGATSFSINMISMFAFIITLGIVVDDAVVVGENVYHYRRQGHSFLDAAIMGAKEVAMPVVFSVLTNIVAFMPLWFVPGFMGKIFKTIPLVVLCVFLVSLVESLFVLPAHLSHHPRRPLFWPLNKLEAWQTRFSERLERFIHQRYGAFLDWALNNRVALLAAGVAILIATAGYVASGRLGLVMFPEVESDFAYCEAVLPYGASRSRLQEVESRLLRAAQAVARDNGGDKLSQGVASSIDENTIKVRFYLTDAQVRPHSTAQVTQLWREQFGTMAGLESINFSSNQGGPGSGKNLTIQLSHKDKEILDQAGAQLAESLAEFSIIYDIDDGSAKGKRQYNINLQPAGERMGLTSKQVASQVRAAFYGAEAVKQQRGRNEVTVRVRLPEVERVTESTLEEMVLQAPQGEILLRDAVNMVSGRAYTSLERINSRRILSVTGNVRPPSQSENIQRELQNDILPKLADQYSGLSYSFEGHQAEIRESLSSLITGLGLALLCVYALLAIPFRSYLQPVIIMFCIPFGMIGAILGHILMGYALAVNSLFGIVALSGVVVNDSLVMIDFANRQRLKGIGPFEAIKSAGIQRFRPILLTTLTTFGGLAPMILETSRQARFIIPMAISLGFGILFATFITLVMVPCLYLLLEDLKQRLFRERREDEPMPVVPVGNSITPVSS